MPAAAGRHRLLWAAGSLAAAAAAATSTSHHPTTCHNTRLGRPCVTFGPNDFGIDPESTACHKLAHMGTPVPLCHVSDNRDEVGVCAESCRPWSAPTFHLPRSLEERGALRQLDGAVELIQQGQLEDAEALLTADIKRLFVRENPKHSDEDQANTNTKTDSDVELNSSSIHDLVTAAHSLRLLGQINHDQGALSRAQLHLEMACKLLDQIYGAPFEPPAAREDDNPDSNYSKECYEELLEVLYGQQLHRKALAIESYLSNDDELFPLSELVDTQRDEDVDEAEPARPEAGAEELNMDKGEDTQEDEDEDEDESDDIMEMLKAIARSFVRASPAVRRKLIKTAAEELSLLVPEVRDEGTAQSRVGAAVSFLQELMRECVAGGKKIHAQNEHCRRHISTEVASLLASIEYSRQKVDEAHFLVELQGQGPMCLPQQQMLRSKSYELSMLVELALSFQEEFEELEDEDAESVAMGADKHSGGRRSDSSNKVAPTPWSWLEALGIAGLIGLVGFPAAKRRIELTKKTQGPAWKATRGRMRDQAMKRFGVKSQQQPPPPAPPPQQQQHHHQHQPSHTNCEIDQQHSQAVSSEATGDNSSAVTNLQPRRVSKKEIRRQRKAKRAAAVIERAKSEGIARDSTHVHLAETERTTCPSIEEIVDVAGAAAVGRPQRHSRATDARADADLNSIEPLSLWESHRESGLTVGDQRRKPPLPKSPVWSVRSSDSDGADSVGSGSYDEDDDLQDVRIPTQQEKSTRGKKTEQQATDDENLQAKLAVDSTQSPHGGVCESRRAGAANSRMANDSKGTGVAEQTRVERVPGNSTSSSCRTGTQVRNLESRDCDDLRPTSMPRGSNRDVSATAASVFTSQQLNASRSTVGEDLRARTQPQTSSRTATPTVPGGMVLSSAESVSSELRNGRPSSSHARPQQQQPVAIRSQPRKRMLTAAEVRARDALANEKRQAAARTILPHTTISTHKKKLRQSSDAVQAAGIQRAAKQALVHRGTVKPRSEPSHRQTAFAVQPNNYRHTLASPAASSAVELIDDGTGTMMAVPAKPADRAGHSNMLSHPLSATTTLTAVRQQVEYYFSDANLAKDKWLVSQMDAEGWIDLALLATFNRVRALTTSMEEIYHALSLSHQLELTVVSWSPPLAKVRRAPTTKVAGH